MEKGLKSILEEQAQRKRKDRLRRWLALPSHLYLRLSDGEKSPASFDERQVGTDRVSSVQYLTFDTGGRAPVGIGCSMEDPDVGLEIELTSEQRAALAEDLP